MLWALGNYSFFLKKGMERIDVSRSDLRSLEQTLGGVMISSFVDEASGNTVTIAINYGTSYVPIKISSKNINLKCSIYRTSANEDLKKIGETKFEEAVSLVPRSITTFVE